MDVSLLESVIAATGPYATVRADATDATENADTVLELVEGAAAHGLSVRGTVAVVEALRHVETRVLADEQEDGTLLAGRSPLEPGVDQHDMDALGVHGEAVPADRALLAAAVAGAAAVVVLPEAAMPDGASVAAVLRCTGASTPSS